jgi:hypothetical protein
LKDALLFSARHARIAFVAAPDGLPTRRVAITLVARNHVLAQYERLIGSLGMAVVHAAPAACHLFNLVARTAEAAGDATHALLNLAPGSATLILCQRGVPHSARTFPWPDSEPHAALGAELFRTFEHAADTAGLAPPRDPLVGRRCRSEPVVGLGTVRDPRHTLPLGPPACSSSLAREATTSAGIRGLLGRPRTRLTVGLDAQSCVALPSEWQRTKRPKPG